jgi:outer membrane protein TolC
LKHLFLILIHIFGIKNIFASEDTLNVFFKNSFQQNSDSSEQNLVFESSTQEARSAFWPQLNVGANSRASKNYQYADSKNINSNQKPEGSSQLQAVVSQNLYRSGQDSFKLNVSQIEQEKHNIQIKISLEQYTLKGFLSLFQIQNLLEVKELKLKQSAQAQSIFESAERKLKSGLLSSTDFLRAQQELLRNKSEFQLAERAHFSAMMLFLKEYQTDAENLQKTLLPSIKFIEEKIQKICETSDTNCFYERIKNKEFLNVVLSKTNVKLGALEVEQNQKRQFLTSLDFSLGGTLSFQDKVNIKGPIYNLSPNRVFTPYAQLDLKISAFDKKTFSQLQGSAYKEKAAQKQLDILTRKIESQMYSLASDINSKATALSNNQKLIETERQIYMKISRLFSAGESPLETLINSQKSLNEIEIVQVKQRLEFLSLKNKFYFAENKGVLSE